MTIHNEYITIQTEKKREFRNITANVKDAAAKSGIHNGLILVSSLHSNSGLFVSDEDPGLLQDVDEWAGKLAPLDAAYRRSARAEGSAGALLQSLLLNHQATIGLTEGKLELGPWQHVIYAELDGQRPKRILIKVLGE